MTKVRLEAFSDGVIAILITIMVLELKVPIGTKIGLYVAVALSWLVPDPRIESKLTRPSS